MAAGEGWVREVSTPHGPARVRCDEPVRSAVGTLVLGHGAGGATDGPDLLAVAAAGAAAGWQVLRVDQPWRVAGKRVAPAPPRLDESWRAVLADLRAHHLLTGPLVLGGRSAGARVACRAAAEQQAAGVLALAFPLHPPARPERSRAPELTTVEVPLLVVQGERDAFGGPAAVSAVLVGRPGSVVRGVPGDHSLRQDPAAVARAAAEWLTALPGT